MYRLDNADAQKMTEKLLQKSQFTWKKVAVWLFVIIVYNFLGAFTFVYVEECNGDYQSTQLQDKIHVNTTENIIKLCAEIKEIVDVNNCTGNFLSLNRLPYFNNLCRQVEELHRLNTTKSTDAKTIEPECNMLNYNLISKWSTFCLVSILTIGYGDVVPKTTTGKMLTVLYVIIGIPLALCLLTNLADNMLALHFVAVDFIDEKILRQEKRTYVNMKVFTLNIFFLLLTVTFMVGLVCVHDRSMTVVNSFYFVIITITTVGYGKFA